MGPLLAVVGFLGFLVGSVAVIYPLKRIGIHTRKHGGYVILGSFIVMMTGAILTPSVEPGQPGAVEQAAVTDEQRTAIAEQQAATIATCDADPACVAARAAAADEAEQQAAQAEAERAAEAAAAEAPRQAIRDAVAGLIANEIVYRVDTFRGEAMIDGAVWRALNVDQKRQLVNVLSQYRDISETSLPTIDLLDYQTGRKLADMGVFSGVTIYES